MKNRNSLGPMIQIHCPYEIIETAGLSLSLIFFTLFLSSFFAFIFFLQSCVVKKNHLLQILEHTGRVVRLCKQMNIQIRIQYKINLF